MAVRTDWLPEYGDLTGANWFDVAQAISGRHGMGAVRELLDKSDFFERLGGFSSGDRASLWNWIGSGIAAEQDDGGGLVSDLVNPGGILGSGFVKGYAELDPVTKGGIKAATGAANNFDQGNVKDPLGAVASFTGSKETQPIDWGANPITAQQGGDTLEAARLGGKLMAGYGLATAASAGSAAPSAASGGTSATTAGNSLAGAGDMFGSGAVWESGTAGLGTGGASTGGVLAGSGDMFGSGATWDAGTAGLQGAAPAGVAATGGGAAGGSALLGSGATGALSNPSLIGTVGGAALGALSGTGSKSNTIQTEEGIPDWLMPYVKPALDRYSTEMQNYQTDPYGIMPSAMTQFKNTIDGQFLDPSTNKYLEDYFRLGSERIKGSLSPSFGHMQAFGQHSGYNEALSRGLGDYAVGLYGGAYEKERDRQNQMTAAAPAFLGQSTQAQFQPFSQYLQSVGALGKSKETPFYTNPWASILGGAATGSQFGSLWK